MDVMCDVMGQLTNIAVADGKAVEGVNPKVLITRAEVFSLFSFYLFFILYHYDMMGVS